MKRRVEAHPRLWSVVRFHGAGRSVRGLCINSRTLLSLHSTKAEADEAAAKVKGAFVLPPKSALAGKESALACEEKAS
jgi:hypothetical protein